MQYYCFIGDIRVCNYCHKIVQVYLNDDLEKSIQTLSEDMKACETGYQDLYYGSSGSIGSSKVTFNLEDHAFGRVQVSGRCNYCQYTIMVFL